jgi:threonylcarbamoyladenosine tRNA methylthiotransferase CDKAL1
MLRVGMTNPPYMLQHIDAVAALLRHPRCYAFLHVPVQSGSNAVLAGMNREYTVEQFKQVFWSLEQPRSGRVVLGPSATRRGVRA